MTGSELCGSEHGGANCSQPCNVLPFSGRIAKDGFQLKEFLESGLAPLAAVTRLFVASKTAPEIHSCAIDVYIARTNSFCHPARALKVSRRHIAWKAIRRVVGNSDRVIFVLIRNDAKNRPEYLLACNGHVVADVAEYSGLHEITLCETIRTPGPSRDQRGTLVDAGVDQALHLLELGLASQRAHSRTFGERVADFSGFGCLPRRRGRRAHARLWHKHASRRVTGLTRVAEARLDALLDGSLEIGIFQDDVGRLATQFLSHAFDCGSCSRGDRDSRPSRSGKGDHRHVRMRSNCGTDRGTIAIDQIENSRRNTRFVQNLRKKIGRERRDFAGLKYHRASRRQRGRHLTDNLVHRPVPRSNESAHPNRLFAHEGRTLKLLKLEVFKHLHHLQEMCETCRNLRLSGERYGSAHLLRNSIGHLLSL